VTLVISGGTIMGHGANISVIDSNSPTWDNVITGQVNLYDAIRRQVDFKLNGKDYKLRTDRALPTLIVRYIPTPSPATVTSLL